MCDMTNMDLVGAITPKEVERAQDALGEGHTDQNLHYIVVARRTTGKGSEPLYRICEEDEVFIGHFRDDRASYFARGLQDEGLKRITGYIKFSDDYANDGGAFVLPESSIGIVDNNLFEILFDKRRVVRLVSEDEKKKHVGRNAHGRRELLWSNECQVSIPMKETKCEYANVPEMNTEQVADQVIQWLDLPSISDIIANMLSSDMMKHTGDYRAAKRGNEVTDHALGRVKKKIDSLRDAFFDRVEQAAQLAGKEPLTLSLRQQDFEAWLAETAAKDASFAEQCRQHRMAVPYLVVTADHGASEAGLAAEPADSSTAHTANRVPYIVYDPLRTSKIPLKQQKTIRNNAATLLHLLGYQDAIPSVYEESLLPDDFEGHPRRLAVVILDGWGVNEGQEDAYDAIRTASTPTYDWLMEHASSTLLAASGKEIGLREKLAEQQEPELAGQQEDTSDEKRKSIYDPDPQPGQTDIGHLHLFSGRLVKQPITLIDALIKGRPIHEGVFDVEKEEVRLIVKRLERVIANEDLRFHHIAFGSEGGVHSCLSHLYALMRLAKSLGMPKDKFVIHFVAEGRDVLVPRSAERFLRDLLEKTEEIGIGVVATVFGRSEWIRKDGHKKITERAVNALTGNLSPFTVRDLL